MAIVSIQTVDSSTIKGTFRSDFTGKVTEHILPVTKEQLSEWAGGELIQLAMPNLNSDQRELFITGASPEEWDNMFGDVPDIIED